MSLIFYDTETTGIDPFFAQILQFAAVRTDTDLNEIDRFEIRCRLQPHVVPAPEALDVTRVNLATLLDAALPSHYEMIRAVRAKLLSWSPSLLIGWNSIRFDEEFLRQGLYKTLHNPYLTNTNGNTRSDAMRMAQACSLFAPDCLAFPTDDEGQRLFRLHLMAQCNGFNHDRAHDAMADVLAAVFISKLINERAPHVWSAFMRFSKKATVAEFIADERMFCVTTFVSGKPYPFIATTIGQNQENKAEWYVYNLDVDPDQLAALTDEELLARIGQMPKPIRRLKSNAAPILFSVDDALGSVVQTACDVTELERRAERLQSDGSLRSRMVKLFESQTKQYEPSPHIEMQIYQGFAEKDDEALMEEFHRVPWAKRPSVVERFLDARLKAIGQQLIFIEQPHHLDRAVYRLNDAHFKTRLLGNGVEFPWMTLPKALSEIEELLRVATGMDFEYFSEHQRHLRSRHDALMAEGGSVHTF